MFVSVTTILRIKRAEGLNHHFIPSFFWDSCYSIFSFMCMFCRSLFVLFLFTIVLSVLRFADSDYAFGISRVNYFCILVFNISIIWYVNLNTFVNLLSKTLYIWYVIFKLSAINLTLYLSNYVTYFVFQKEWFEFPHVFSIYVWQRSNNACIWITYQSLSWFDIPELVFPIIISLINRELIEPSLRRSSMSVRQMKPNKIEFNYHLILV
jgi:hypothetical protein